MHRSAAGPNYEPEVCRELSGAVAKQRGITALEALYDHLAEGDGGNLIYFPIFNYNEGSLEWCGRCSATRAHSPA